MNTPQLPGRYEVKSEIIINTSASVAWDLLKDFGHVSNWAPSVTKSYYLGTQTSGIGTGRHCDIAGFGSIQEVITDWQEGKGFTYSVTPLGPLAKSRSTWWLEHVDDQTTKLQVTFSYDLRYGLLGKILHKLVMRKKLEQSLPETLAATKNHLEVTLQFEPVKSPLPAIN